MIHFLKMRRREIELNLDGPVFFLADRGFKHSVHVERFNAKWLLFKSMSRSNKLI